MACQSGSSNKEERNLAPLDVALNELGMLATSTHSRNEYLSEIKNRNYVHMFRQYVSNVCFKVRPSTPHVRHRPYKMPVRTRHRTRSENNDVELASNLAQKLVEDCLNEISELKKAKSLESIVAEGADRSNHPLQITFGSHGELEQVSEGVQNMKVTE